jgi:hypothetical protein
VRGAELISVIDPWPVPVSLVSRSSSIIVSLLCAAPDLV